jgi:hypothetical protein
LAVINVLVEACWIVGVTKFLRCIAHMHSRVHGIDWGCPQR